MFLLLLSLSLSLVGAQPTAERDCDSSDSCWGHPENGLATETRLASEERVLATLLCHLDCLDRGEDGDTLSQCQVNCLAMSGAPPTLNSTLPPPTFEPNLTELSRDGLYGIRIPNVTTVEEDRFGSGSGVTVIGSGETGSGSGLEVYSVRICQFRNSSYFPMTSQYAVINLAEFACCDVQISYAIVMRDGVISDYSPSLTAFVFIPRVQADPARDLMVSFEEDILFPQQAILHLSWDEPSNTTGLEGYVLCIKRTAPSGGKEDKDCSSQLPMSHNIDPGQVNITIEPMEVSRLTSPLYSCTYIIELISLPGSNGISQEVKIAYRSADQRVIEPRCNATYIPSAVSYDLAISWTLADPLVLEAVKDSEYKMELIPEVRFPDTEMLSYFPPPGQTDFQFVFQVRVTENSLFYILDVDPLRPRPGISDEFFWRRPIIPRSAQCRVATTAFPPTPVSSDDITLQLMPLLSGLLNFRVSWDTPTFLNGDLVRYELCIREEGVSGGEFCSFPSDCFYIVPEDLPDGIGIMGCTPVGRLSSPEQPAANISYHVISGTELLLMQIRAVNEFGLEGEWSEAVVLLNLTREPEIGPPSNRDSSSQEVWVYVVVALLCVIVSTLAVLLIVYVYRHFCFHRRIKYDDTMVMARIGGDYLPPSLIPVADEWEVSSEDIEIFYAEELGHGAFGRVYRGFLHSRELRDMVSSGGGGRRSTRKRGSFGRRRSSQRKNQSSQIVGSRLVAVKRLRDNIDGPDKASFLKEIEMMKKVSGSYHDHQKFVVNMLGCVTVQEPMMLVLEYATHGDLLTYLRNSRDEDGDGAINPKAAPYLEPKGAYSHLPSRDTKEEEAEGEEEDKKLTAKDLLSFSRQIAAGMEFLASLNVVHRDLACRNILVCEDRFVKISDFGLSRTLVNQEAYVITTKGVLPIRWMAPEALFYRTFDTQSDVWSYGILLWELYTLGGYPYPTMSNRDILEMLTSGYRMDKPDLCPDEVYDVMLRCWNTLGVARPTFAELYVTFDSVLSETTRFQSPYIQLLGNYYYDRLGPSAQADSSETLDLEMAPANVDMRQPATVSVANSTSEPPPPPPPPPPVATSLPVGEVGNGYLGVSAQGSSGTNSPHPVASGSRSSSQDGVTVRRAEGRTIPGPAGLSVPLHLSRPRSWIGTSSAELGPRYVPTPLHPFHSPHSSTSNLTEETMFGNSVVALSPEHRRLSAMNGQSRSVGSIPLVTSNNLRT